MRTFRNAGLDPETQYREIYRNLVTYEFPWDLNQALSLALFRTYAVPSIGGLLDRTGEFTGRCQKRYDDTAILLEAPLLDGLDGETGRAAIRRINRMHRMYDISDDDMRYVLCTFVVVPVRWIGRFGWRGITDAELLATVRWYQDVGRHMGIKDIPATYDDFAELMDAYEATHFAFDAGGRRVADATLDLLASFYPRPAKRLVNAFSRAVMDPALLAAFGYDDPGPRARRTSEAALRVRARLVARLPARRRPMTSARSRRIRGYSEGFDVESLGTFAPSCPGG